MLDHEHTISLIIEAQSGHEFAKNKLIEENYPLVKSVIRKFRNKGVDYDDLFQLGCVGFVKAINNFDTGYGVHFSTYAVPMIAGEVKRFLRDDGYIKVSRALKSLSIQINRYIATERNNGSDTIDLQKIAEHFNIDVQEVVFALDASRYPVSLSEKADNDDERGGSLIDRIAATNETDTNIDHFILKELIQNLSPRERKIIIMRYYRDKTQSEIASELGVSQVQVSRLENKILEKMKEKFAD